MSYILVVDDEKDIRDLISQILFEEGHTVNWHITQRLQSITLIMRSQT